MSKDFAHKIEVAKQRKMILNHQATIARFDEELLRLEMKRLQVEEERESQEDAIEKCRVALSELGEDA